MTPPTINPIPNRAKTAGSILAEAPGLFCSPSFIFFRRAQKAKTSHSKPNSTSPAACTIAPSSSPPYFTAKTAPTRTGAFTAARTGGLSAAINGAAAHHRTRKRATQMYLMVELTLVRSQLGGTILPPLVMPVHTGPAPGFPCTVA